MKFSFLNLELTVQRIHEQAPVPEFFTQRLNVKKYDANRFEYLIRHCKGKRVLHVGCTDYPIFKPEKNLHIQLDKIAGVLHGLDTDKEGCRELQKYVDQPYFHHFADLTESYDVCLVPETLEHVDNVGSFLEAVETVRAERFIFTVPNCFSPFHMNRNNHFDYENGFVEYVHPDHNAWYSPYTLQNVIKKCSKLNILEVAVIQDESSAVCVCGKV